VAMPLSIHLHMQYKCIYLLQSTLELIRFWQRPIYWAAGHQHKVRQNSLSV